MDFDSIDTKNAQEGAQEQHGSQAKDQHASPTEEDSVLLGAKKSLLITKIQLQEAMQKTIQFCLRAFTVFAAFAVIVILGTGTINFIISPEARWLEPERMNEIKAFLTGGAGAMLASIASDKIKTKDKD